jgi:hypothetical protein
MEISGEKMRGEIQDGEGKMKSERQESERWKL